MSTVMAEIRLLGPPSVHVAGRPARLHSSKTLALLAYLALEGDAVHSREKLASLLWGNSPDARARQSLRQALYSLRRTFGQECVAVEGEAVTWTLRGGVWVDVVEFRRLARGQGAGQAVEPWSRAVDLYRGTLIEGAEPSDCPAYDEWLFFQRDSLEQHLVDLLQRLADELLAQGAYSDALVHCRRLVALNPLHEGAHRRLMRVYGAQGDVDGVRRHYRSCRETLERELGVVPSRDTEVLYRALISVQPVPSVTRASPLSSADDGRLPGLPFVGREQELAALSEQYDRAAHGQARLVLVAGEAGAGKTRLIESFVRAVSEQAGVLSGRCYAPESHAPYAVWADALQALGEPDRVPYLADLDPAWRAQVARLAPALGSPAEEIEGTTAAESKLRLWQGIVQALVHLTKRRPTIMWFDDLHWADEASLELLHYVARQLTAQPLLLVGAYRPAAASDNKALHPLLSSPRVAHTLHLAALAPAAIRQMLLQSGVAAGHELVQRLHRQSEGNPLYLVETLHALFEAGLAQRRPDGGQPDRRSAGRLWEVDLSQPWPVPTRVLDLIRTRVGSLDEQERRALAAGAVIGRPFGLHLLRQVVGLPELQALDVVEDVCRRGFLNESTAGTSGALDEPQLAFRHGYFQRAIYEDLGTLQRRALHRRTADALLQLYRVRPQAVTQEVAYHLEQAGDPEAIFYLVQAARQAQALYAPQRAVELCSRALTLSEASASTDLEQRFELLLVREASLDRQGLRAEQAHDVSELLQLAETMGDAERLAVASIREAGYLSYVGRYETARQAGERALALYRAADNPAGEGQALRELGFISWTAEDYSASLAYGRDALQLYRRQGDVEGEATALHNLAEVHRSLGSPRQSIGQYENALELYWARQDRQRQGVTLYGLGTAYRQLGALDQATLRYRQALEQLEAAEDRLMVSRVHHALGGVHWQRGEVDQALEQMQKAVETSREIGYGPGVAHGLLSLSHLLAQAGDLEVAREQLADAIIWLRLTEDGQGLEEARARLQQLEQDPRVQVPLFPIEIGWVKGHVALAEGKVYCAFESPMAGCVPDDG